MYIQYIYDRKMNGFNCQNDIKSIEQLQIYEKNIKNSYFYIIVKGKKLILIVSSNELLVGVLIFIIIGFGNFPLEVQNTNLSSFDSQISHSRVLSRNNLEFEENFKSFKYNISVKEKILDIRAGQDEFLDTNSQKEKFELIRPAKYELENLDSLGKSLISKAANSDYDRISLNKLFKPVTELVEDIVTHPKFVELVSKIHAVSQSPSPDPISSGSISPSPIIEKYTRSKSGYVEAFSDSFPTRLGRSKKVDPSTQSLFNTKAESIMKMQDDAKNESPNLKRDFTTKDPKEVERLTRLRREGPLSSSEVLGDEYVYSIEQLAKKGKKHLVDMAERLGRETSLEGKSKITIASEYQTLIEGLLQKEDLITIDQGRLNKLENVTLILDPASGLVVVFEDNPLYKEKHFVTAYPKNKEQITECIENKNVGLSFEERAERNTTTSQQQAEAAQRKAEKAKIAQERKEFHDLVPKDIRVTNKQIVQAENLKRQFDTDANFQLSPADQKLIERVENYQSAEAYHKQQKLKNPKIDKNEL